MRLKNKTALITGAANGIGERFASGLAEEGANIVIADVADGESVARQINQLAGDNHGNAAYIHCDVSEETSCEAMAKATHKQYGHIDILIANAALFSQITPRSFMDISVAEWDRVMAVNVKGLWLSVKAVVPYMPDTGGAIINIATNRIFTGIPYMLQYDASKGAVAAMTRVMAVELGEKNIRVNAIAPGLTMTERVSQRQGIQERAEKIIAAKPLKRTQNPQDLVGAAVFLASEDSAQITGQTIVVDGGGIMR